MAHTRVFRTISPSRYLHVYNRPHGIICCFPYQVDTLFILKETDIFKIYYEQISVSLSNCSIERGNDNSEHANFILR